MATQIKPTMIEHVAEALFVCAEAWKAHPRKWDAQLANGSVCSSYRQLAKAAIRAVNEAT